MLPLCLDRGVSSTVVRSLQESIKEWKKKPKCIESCSKLLAEQEQKKRTWLLQV